MSQSLNDLEFKRMFSGEMDPNDAYVDIQAGSGGTEAQDWGQYVTGHVPEMGRGQRVQGRTDRGFCRRVAGIKVPPFRYQVVTHLAG